MQRRQLSEQLEDLLDVMVKVGVFLLLSFCTLLAGWHASIRRPAREGRVCHRRAQHRRRSAAHRAACPPPLPPAPLAQRKLLQGKAKIIEARVPIIKCKLNFGVFE